MHLHFEKSTNTKCDCSILSLSWMGKVPDDIPESCVFHVFTFNNKTVQVSITSDEPVRSLTGNMTIYGIRWAN